MVFRSTAARWSLVALIAIVGVVIALLTTLDLDTLSDSAAPPATSADLSERQVSPPTGAPPANGQYTVADDQERQAADLPACRDAAAPATTGARLSGVMVGCMADGSQTSLGKIQAGKPMLINLWAYWCGPCRKELPAINDAAKTLGDEVTVVLSHTDPSETKGLATLQDMNLHLISVSDPDEQLPVVAGAPPVLPLTVLVKADGTIATVLVEPMYTEQEVLDAVSEHLGITV